jgi:hypothetical protein
VRSVWPARTRWPVKLTASRSTQPEIRVWKCWIRVSSATTIPGVRVERPSSPTTAGAVATPASSSPAAGTVTAARPGAAEPAGGVAVAAASSA